MISKKELAIKYRLKGYTYSEISKIVAVPKSTLSTWLKDLVISSSAQTKITEKYTAGYLKGLKRKAELQTKAALTKHSLNRKESAKQLKSLTKRELQVLGIGLYWGEGYKKIKVVNGKQKTVHPVSLSNADPFLIKAYIYFLKVVCNVPLHKMRASIRLYKHQNEPIILKYWQNITGLPKTQFTKSYVGISKSSLGKKPYNILPNGTIRIDVYDTSLFYTILGWIDGIKKQF